MERPQRFYKIFFWRPKVFKSRAQVLSGRINSRHFSTHFLGCWDLKNNGVSKMKTTETNDSLNGFHWCVDDALEGRPWLLAKISLFDSRERIIKQSLSRMTR